MKKICAGLLTLTLVLVSAIISFSQSRPKRGVVFIGGGSKTGATIGLKSKSRGRVHRRKLIGTTYVGDGPKTMRKRGRR